MEKSNKTKDKEDKEEKAKQEKEKEYRIKTDIEALLSNFNISKSGFNLKTYIPHLECILDLWTIKLKEKEVINELNNTTNKILEYALNNKELSPFFDELSEERKILLAKVFYSLYDKISSKSNNTSIKASKLNTIHSRMIQSEGLGFVGRSFFSIQK